MLNPYAHTLGGGGNMQPPPTDYVYYSMTPVVGDTGINWGNVDKTFSFWLDIHVNPSSLYTWLCNIWGGASDGLGLIILDTGSLRVHDDSDGNDVQRDTGFTLTDSAVYHIIFEVDYAPRQMRTIVNGVIGSWVTYDGVLVVTAAIVLGERGNDTYHYDGTEKKAKIYNRLLTASEKLALYTEGAG